MRGVVMRLFAVAVVLLSATHSLADEEPPLTKAQCVDAAEQAIKFRSSGKLRDARAQLVQCGRDECPAIVKEDCSSQVVSIDARIPTIAFGAKEEGSNLDITNIRVFVDGEEVAAAADGRAQPFDPGQHQVRVVTLDHDPPYDHTDTIMFREGEKSRVIVFNVPAKKIVEPPPPPLSRPPPKRVSPLVPITIGAVGVIGLGTAGILSLHLDGRVDDLRGSCAPGCSSDDRSSLSTELAIVNVSLIAGITALATAGVIAVITQPWKNNGSHYKEASR